MQISIQPRFLFFILFSGLAVQFASGQTASSTSTSQVAGSKGIVRDVQGLALLQNAITAMGGTSVVAQVGDTTATGSVEPASGSSVKNGTFTWMTSGSDFKYVKQAGSSSLTLVSGHGRPAIIRDGSPTALLSHEILANPPFHVPALIFAAANANKNYSVGSVSKVTLNGVSVLKLRLSLESDAVSSLVTPQDWYFEPASGIPIRVEHRLPDHLRAESFVLAAEDFSDYRIVAGLAVPFKITSYEDGKLQAIATVNSVHINTGLSPTEFDSPAGGAQ